ncbi:hypothetical protein LWI28_020820 [Acer negundo]|uniref:Uncharacterized protein n=1 Tax=Acer negundo TaxID=4023 RepID=A0AAD5IWJ0_ACENE|nr:hypothetical protein LWI28_020820 [Acer negundo]
MCNSSFTALSSFKHQLAARVAAALGACVEVKRLWFLRNNYAHDSRRHELGTVVEWCERYLVEYGNAIGAIAVCDSVQVLELVRWVSPMVGMYKLNTDAAIGGLRPCVGVSIECSKY